MKEFDLAGGTFGSGLTLDLASLIQNLAGIFSIASYQEGIARARLSRV